MKSMKAAASSASMSMSQSYKDVAEKTGLKQGEVKSVMESMFEIATGELKKTGSFQAGWHAEHEVEEQTGHQGAQR